jgi:hypothetical protein
LSPAYGFPYGYICTDMHAKPTADVLFAWLTTIEGE